MEQIYRKWRDSLKKPDDSIFYYHPSLERIVLGLAMYEIASRPYLRKLGKAKSLTLYNLYINEMVTAWIYDSDEYKESFAYTFDKLMLLSEAFFITGNAMIQRYPSLKKTIRNLQYSFGFWPAMGGDISDKKAEELLDDIATDGKRIDSEKIELIVKKLQPDVVGKGMELDPIEALSLIESVDIGNKNDTSADTLAGMYDSNMAKIEFLPVISLFSDIKFPQGQTYHHRALTESAVLMVERFAKDDVVQYMNLYFIRCELDRIKIAVCFGDVINSVYGRNVLGASSLEPLPESAKHTFPYIYALINERTVEDIDKAYLNTISFNQQTKQWFVMKNIMDKDGKLWEDILMRGPFNSKLKNPVKEVINTIANIFKNLNSSGDQNVMKHLNTYMEKGQSSCDLVKYTPSTL